MAFYDRLQTARRNGGAHYLYEATVGAGLPIIETLRDLRKTGDEIRRIEGMLSGTLAYLFNVWDGSKPFSAIVRDAKAKGYTEPDPRDDLSGVDFARKIVLIQQDASVPAGTATYKLTAVYPDVLGNDLDLLVRYQVNDISNTNQTYQSNIAVMKALITKYHEFKEAFAGVNARAVDPSGRDYGTLLSMKDIK